MAGLTRRQPDRQDVGDSAEPCYRLRVAVRTPGSPLVRHHLKKSEVVSLRIVQDISEQGLGSGDPLPLESEMLAHYKVSRSTLREALRLLEAQGLIVIRTGPRGGTTVGAPSAFFHARATIPYLHLAGATYGDALEAWAQTEQLLARAAANNPDRERVRAMLSPFVSGGATHREWGVNEGIGFHETIAMLTDNPVLDLMLRSLAHVVSDHILNSMPPEGLADWMVLDHEQLAEAVISGDPMLAERLMADHSRRVIEEFARFAPHRIGERIGWF